MARGREALEELNINIGDAESKGERKRLARFIAPKLAFRRGDRTTFDSRAAFLKKAEPSEPREIKVESIDVYGDRAIVRCFVSVKHANGDKRFHNLRWALQPNPNLDSTAIEPIDDNDLASF